MYNSLKLVDTWKIISKFLKIRSQIMQVSTNFSYTDCHSHGFILQGLNEKFSCTKILLHLCVVCACPPLQSLYMNLLWILDGYGFSNKACCECPSKETKETLFYSHFIRRTISMLVDKQQGWALQLQRWVGVHIVKGLKEAKFWGFDSKNFDLFNQQKNRLKCTTFIWQL